MTAMMPAPASTVVLVRERRPDRNPTQVETLLLLRNPELAFAGGTWVFPGGKIDASDYPPVEMCTSHWQRKYLAATNAAARETREETGLRIPAGELIHIAHWTTPPGYARRYATWFFLCPVSTPADVEVDSQEILDHQWVTPRRALTMQAAGELLLTRPTAHTLTSLLQFPTLTTLCQAMRTESIHVFPEGSEYYQPVSQRACGEQS